MHRALLPSCTIFLVAEFNQRVGTGRHIIEQNAARQLTVLYDRFSRGIPNAHLVRHPVFKLTVVLSIQLRKTFLREWQRT